MDGWYRLLTLDARIVLLAEFDLNLVERRVWNTAFCLPGRLSVHRILIPDNLVIVTKDWHVDLFLLL